MYCIHYYYICFKVKMELSVFLHVEPILISLFLFMFQIKIYQQILNVSYGFQHMIHMEGQNGTTTHNFDIIFQSDFDRVFFFTFTFLKTISCLPVSNVSKISVYKICLEIYLCILNSEFYVMYRISLHSMWQITTKHFMFFHSQYVADHHQTLHVLHII